MTSQNIKVMFKYWPSHPPTKIKSSLVINGYISVTNVDMSLQNNITGVIFKPTHPLVKSIWSFPLPLKYGWLSWLNARFQKKKMFGLLRHLKDRQSGWQLLRNPLDKQVVQTFWQVFLKNWLLRPFLPSILANFLKVFLNMVIRIFLNKYIY